MLGVNKFKMKLKEFMEQFKIILDQHIILIKSNSHLLQINLGLMKEIDELNKRLGVKK